MADDKDAPVTGFELERSVSHLLHRAQQYAAETFDAQNGSGITLRQFAVLAAVNDQAGCSQSDLVRVTGIDRSTLADMLKRMEARELIERRPAKLDARAKAVHLTETGKAAFEAALPGVAATDEVLLSALPRNRRRAFTGILSLLSYADSDHEIDPELPEDVKARKKKAAARDGDQKKKKKKKKHKKD